MVEAYQRTGAAGAVVRAWRAIWMVPAITRHQGVSAIPFLYLYRNVLDVPMGWVDGMVWAKRARRLPTVLSRAERRGAWIGALDCEEQLMLRLMYGAGLRLLELLRLRVKDVDLDGGSLLVRCGKGQKDRVTVLPASIRDQLQAHLEAVRKLHQRDIARGAGYVELPRVLGAKLLGAPRDWPWQWVFPARRFYRAPVPGSCALITCTRACSSGPSHGPRGGAGYRSASRATPSGTPPPPTCWRMGTTSVPFRNYSATAVNDRLILALSGFW